MHVFGQESRFCWLRSRPFWSMSGAPRPRRGQKSGGFAPRPSRELVVCTYGRFFRFFTLRHLMFFSFQGLDFLFRSFLFVYLGVLKVEGWIKAPLNASTPRKARLKLARNSLGKVQRHIVRHLHGRRPSAAARGGAIQRVWDEVPDSVSESFPNKFRASFKR